MKRINEIHHNNWVDEIKEYIGEKSDKELVLYCMSYTLQSLRNGEDMSRFNWGNKDG